jgi:GTPase SAR1 family protein
MGERKYEQIPPGLNLQHTLLGHEDLICGITWSADGQSIASASRDRTIRLWNVMTGEEESIFINKGRSGTITSVSWSVDGRELIAGTTTKNLRSWDRKTGKPTSRQGHSASINSVAFSPNGRMRASGSSDKTIRLCNASDGKLRSTLKEHTGEILCLTWSPNSQVLASGSGDKTIRLWSAKDGKCLRTFQGHTGAVLSVAFSPDGRMLASASKDCTIRIWDYKQKRLRNILEGHTDEITCISFSFDSRLLASKSTDGTVKLWRCDTWEMVGEIAEPASHILGTRLAFHPTEAILATLGEENTAIRIWDLDIEAILSTPLEVESVRYSNAKVILLGNTGVGKSGLGRVLTGNPFEKTESTHGRHVWLFDSQEIEVGNGHTEMHEVLLWDLAGQPSYRLIHQLHLNEVSVALVVFDAGSDLDPFAGVHYWNRALNEAQRLQGDSALPLKKFLVAARVDRGGIDASAQRIDTVVRELGFDGCFQTSAREGWQIKELAEAIRKAIDWNVMPSVSSTELFQKIKAFLVNEKQAGRLLSSVEDLFRAFLQSETALPGDESFRSQFETCIGRVESQGLIRRLSFGNLILLQPEMLDAYASALVIAAKDESDGLGCIAEIKARSGNFRMSGDERIPDKEQEKLLLLATVEDLLHHEIALREESEDGTYLVFPSQFTRELPNVTDPEGKAVTFEFEGAVQSVYSRLAVRLSHSGLFKKQEMWKNAAIFTTHIGSRCGLLLRQIEEGRAELTLFFDELASEETRFQFEEYIHTYLRRQVMSESIKRRRLFVCLTCSTPVTEQQAKKRRDLGFDFIRCNVCDTNVSLLDREERLSSSPVDNSEAETESEDLAVAKIAEMDRAADNQRARDTAASILEGKIATQDFDVFLCYNNEDKAAVKKIGHTLKETGILPWFDEWELRPGLSWQRLLEQQIGQIRSVAVFVGSEGIGPWQNPEQEAFLREFANRGCPVIPILLPNAPSHPKLPIFLKGKTWIDFREQDPDPMEQFLWGITGKRGVLRDTYIKEDNLKAELRVKDQQVKMYEKHNADLVEIFKTQRPMNPEVNQYFHGPVGNVAGTNYGSMTTYINQNHDDIVRLLASLRNMIQQFPEEQKEDALMDLDGLESDLKIPEKQDPNRFGKRLKRLLAAGTAAGTIASGAATFSGDIKEFTNNILELTQNLGVPIELVQPPN